MFKGTRAAVAYDDRCRGIYTLLVKIGFARMWYHGKRIAEQIPRNQHIRKMRWWWWITNGAYCTDSKFHAGWQYHAVDILVPDGTPVVAAADGIIIAVREHNEKWGLDDSNAQYLNCIMIKHGNGELTWYAHLAKGSVSVRGLSAGSHVRRGQIIATVGKSGCVGNEQLHFCVLKKLPPGTTVDGIWLTSLAPRFRWYGYL